MAKHQGAIVPVNGSSDQLVFDERPIELAGFRLRARSAVPVGKPKIQQFQQALAFACAAHEGSPYWVGDLMAYAESREDWKEKLDQAVAITGLARHTLTNLGYISRHVEEPERQIAPTPAHSAEVASLPRPDETAWLDGTRTEGWTVREMRAEIRAARRRKVIEGQAAIDGMFRVLLCDYPWPYNDSGPTEDGSLGKQERHFPGLPIEEGCELPIRAHALPNSIMFFWVTAPFLCYASDGITPDWYRLLQAWGFEPKTGRVWDKVLGMHSSYATHITHEHLIIATRGSCLPDVALPEDKSILVERRSPVHSEKPESIRHWIEQHWTTGPYLELFGRKPVRGWTVFGNDAALWPQQMGAAS